MLRMPYTAQALRQLWQMAPPVRVLTLLLVMALVHGGGFGAIHKDEGPGHHCAVCVAIPCTDGQIAVDPLRDAFYLEPVGQQAIELELARLPVLGSQFSGRGPPEGGVA